MKQHCTDAGSAKNRFALFRQSTAMAGAIVLGCFGTIPTIAADITSAAEAEAASSETTAPVIKGVLELPILSLRENLGSLRLHLGKRAETTGPITIQLDPRAREKQRVVLDFNTGQVRIETNLLITAPLLKKLREPDIRVAVVEHGPFTTRKIVSSRNSRRATLEVSFETTSDFRFTSGVLANAYARNKKDPARCPKYPPQNCYALISLDLDGNGNILSGRPVNPRGSFLRANDNGTLMLQGEQIHFSGERDGTVGRGVGRR